MLFVKDCYTFREEKFSSLHCEIVCGRLFLPNAEEIVTCIYRPPETHVDAFVSDLDMIIKTTTAEQILLY